jgi:hypothetical protein
MTERFLVVGEPVERALPYNRHHDLDGFGVPNMPAQNVVSMFDGADDEDVPAHAWKRTAEDSPPTARCPIRAHTPGNQAAGRSQSLSRRAQLLPAQRHLSPRHGRQRQSG